MLLRKALTLGLLSFFALAATFPNPHASSQDHLLSVRAPHNAESTFDAPLLPRGLFPFKSPNSVASAPKITAASTLPIPLLRSDSGSTFSGYALECLGHRASNVGQSKKCEENCSCKGPGRVYCGNNKRFISAERTEVFIKRLTAVCGQVCQCLDHEDEDDPPFR